MIRTRGSRASISWLGDRSKPARKSASSTRRSSRGLASRSTAGVAQATAAERSRRRIGSCPRSAVATKSTARPTSPASGPAWSPTLDRASARGPPADLRRRGVVPQVERGRAAIGAVRAHGARLRGLGRPPRSRPVHVGHGHLVVRVRPRRHRRHLIARDHQLRLGCGPRRADEQLRRPLRPRTDRRGRRAAPGDGSGRDGS